MFTYFMLQLEDPLVEVPDPHDSSSSVVLYVLLLSPHLGCLKVKTAFMGHIYSKVVLLYKVLALYTADMGSLSCTT